MERTQHCRPAVQYSTERAAGRRSIGRLPRCLQKYNKTSVLICLAILALNPLMNKGKRALGLSLSLLPQLNKMSPYSLASSPSLSL